MTMTSRSNATLGATLRRVSLAAALAFVGAPLALSAISAPAMAQAGGNGGGNDRGGGDGSAGAGAGGGSSDGIYDVLHFDAARRNGLPAPAVAGQGPQQPPSYARQRRVTPVRARGEYAQNPCGQIRIIRDINGDPIRYTCIR